MARREDADEKLWARLSLAVCLRHWVSPTRLPLQNGLHAACLPLLPRISAQQKTKVNCVSVL